MSINEMNSKPTSTPKWPARRELVAPHPVKAMKDWTKEKDRKPRKDRERRTHEEKKIANKPARQKRWKDLYETGSLEDGDGEFVDGDVFYDETEERTD